MLTSESFVEKAALLVLTAVLSGFAIPYVANSLNAAAAERQKIIDATKAREEALLQAQTKLWSEFSEIVLIYQTLALDVSWFRTSLVKDDALYERARSRYSDQIVDLVSKWRILASRAQSLASPATSDKMTAFLYKVFQEQDSPMMNLHRSEASIAKWEEQHVRNEGMLSEANRLIFELAKELDLSKSPPHPAPEKR